MARDDRPADSIGDDPTTKPLDRDELLACFVRVLNVCEPEHPYESDPYPVSPADIDYGYKQSTSNYYASCGPRRRRRSNTVAYNVDRAYMNEVSKERHLAVLTHEVTHITEGSHTEGSTHNKAFWREMAFNAWHVRDHFEQIEAIMGEMDMDAFIEEVIEDPNVSMVDRRSESVRERKREMAELMGWDEYTLRMDQGDEYDRFEHKDTIPLVDAFGAFEADQHLRVVYDASNSKSETNKSKSIRAKEVEPTHIRGQMHPRKDLIVLLDDVDIDGESFVPVDDDPLYTAGEILSVKYREVLDDVRRIGDIVELSPREIGNNLTATPSMETGA